jgi:hypothetical protein
MPKHQGMSNLVSKAMLYESKGKRVSQKVGFIVADEHIIIGEFLIVLPLFILIKINFSS